jgi:Tfp pilus assembly protein PilP
VRGRPDRTGDEAGLPPILRQELNQLRLVAITVMSGDAGAALASFEDGAGVSYILRQGDRIGRRQGRIVAIEPDRVVVEEASARGASAPRLTEMKLDVLRDAPGLGSGDEAVW